MELIDVITSKENLNRAYKKVVENKGAGGIDGMKVEELGAYIKDNKDEIIRSIRNRTYMPKPVRRVYIPKDNVNYDKLIQILREQVNDSTTRNQIRKYLKAGVMEKGLERATTSGVPQGGPLSVVLSNVYIIS